MAGTAREHEDIVHRTRDQVVHDLLFSMILPALMRAPLIATAIFSHKVPMGEAKVWSLPSGFLQ